MKAKGKEDDGIKEWARFRRWTGLNFAGCVMKATDKTRHKSVTT